MKAHVQANRAVSSIRSALNKMDGEYRLDLLADIIDRICLETKASGVNFNDLQKILDDAATRHDYQ